MIKHNLKFFICFILVLCLNNNLQSNQSLFKRSTSLNTSTFFLTFIHNKKEILSQNSPKYNRRSSFNRNIRKKSSTTPPPPTKKISSNTKNNKTEEKQSSENKTQLNTLPILPQKQVASNSKTDKKLQQYLDRKQFLNIKKFILSIPVPERSLWHQTLLNKLLLFEKIKTEKITFEANFITEAETNPTLTSQTTQLYLEAQKQFLENKNKLTKDILIQILFLDQKNFEAKALLNQGLKLNANQYIVENIPLKYWLASDVNYYSGNYQAAIEKLNTLLIFEPNNANIYEKLGSNYYNATLFDKAIDAWKIALSLDTTNKELPIIIKNTTTMLKEQKENISKNLNSNSKKSNSINLPKIEHTSLIGVFFDQESAIKFKNQKMKENPNIKLFSYNKENGTIEVRIKKSNPGVKK